MSPMAYTVGRTWAVFLIFSSQIICIWGNCGPPPVIEHTLAVEATPGVPGDSVVYVCDRSTGYYDLPGISRTFTCLDDNTWSPPVFEFCTRACDVPKRREFSVPKDSDLEKDLFLPGTTVSYNCRPGFKRVPLSSNSIICLENYTWSEPSEFCVRRVCGHPGDILNGDFDASDSFLFGSRVTYKCNEGYRLSNKKNYRDCQADGLWTNIAPLCEAAICPAPESPVDGTYTPEKDEYTYLDAVTFTCNKGLHVVGEYSASCTGNGNWSISSPTCKAVNCPDPTQVQNGRKDSGFNGPYTLNSAVRYLCDNGFVMTGSSSITCTVDSQWKPEAPKCLTVCRAPPDYLFAVLEEGFANLNNYFDNTTVLYKCKTGYTRDPEIVNQITCSGRDWSKLAMFCSPKSCGDPGDIMYAERSGLEFTYGSRVNYKCQKGYTMLSSTNYRECQEDGTWSAGDIICSVTCQIPEVANSQIKLGSKRVYVKNDVLVFECETGHVLHGSNSSTCSSRGQWEPSPPECTRSLESQLGIGSIIAIVIAAVVAAIAFVLLYCCCLKKKSGKSKSEIPNVQYTPCKDV
ncbi:complement component receptor 1-like protein isoform X2 [Rhinoderma darwinii]|uniref:complement component receptor 1-like protein isoform X2 n=1 Tax=Rhinoderma darwinii TaxID=43563 RepID=UPI003F676E0E